MRTVRVLGRSRASSGDEQRAEHSGDPGAQGDGARRIVEGRPHISSDGARPAFESVDADVVDVVDRADGGGRDARHHAHPHNQPQPVRSDRQEQERDPGHSDEAPATLGEQCELQQESRNGKQQDSQNRRVWTSRQASSNAGRKAIVGSAAAAFA